MQPLTRDAFRTLLAPQEGPCVTILMPLQRAGAHAHENAARLTSVLTDVEHRLESMNLSPKGRSQFLAPARAFADEQLRAPVDADGAALLLTPSSFHGFALHGQPKEGIFIGRRFHLSPLLGVAAGDPEFFVLAMSRGRCRLIRAADKAQEIQPPGMPTSLKDAWKGMEHTDENLQFHSTGNGTAAFHGGANAKDEDEVEITEYVKQVCKGLAEGLKGVSAPLVFAGVDELWGVFRRECALPQLAAEAVIGNPDEMDADALKAKAEPVGRRAAELRREGVLRRYEAVVGAGKTALIPLDILEAARQGRVDTLLVADGASLWAALDQKTQAATLRDGPEDGAEDLLGLMAAETLTHDGDVMVFPREKMPERADVAALLRY